MTKPREDEIGNTKNLAKGIRTFFKPTANKPEKLKTSPETERLMILDFRFLTFFNNTLLDSIIRVL